MFGPVIPQGPIPLVQGVGVCSFFISTQSKVSTLEKSEIKIKKPEFHLGEKLSRTISLLVSARLFIGHVTDMKTNKDTRTSEQLGIALARNSAELASRIMAAHPYVTSPDTHMLAKLIKSEADAFLNRVLPSSKRAK